MLTYREATQNDLPAICVLGEEVNALHYEDSPHLFAPAGDLERRRAHWQLSINAPMATTFVAADSAIVVGFITISVIDETHTLMQPLRYARIGTVGVANTHRGAGIGHALMTHAETWAKARSAVDIRLVVGAFNEGAIRLYEELGYTLLSQSLGKQL